MNKPNKLLILDSDIFIHHPPNTHTHNKILVCLRSVQLSDRFITKLLQKCKNCTNLALVLVLSKQCNNFHPIIKWLKADIPGSRHETGTMIQSFMRKCFYWICKTIILAIMALIEKGGYLKINQ